jgi:hypothetical protein
MVNGITVSTLNAMTLCTCYYLTAPNNMIKWSSERKNCFKMGLNCHLFCIAQSAPQERIFYVHHRCIFAPGASNEIEPSFSAIEITSFLGTKRNSASLSINFLINQGQAILSTFAFLLVTYFISISSVSLFLNFRSFFLLHQSEP